MSKILFEIDQTIEKLILCQEFDLDEQIKAISNSGEMGFKILFASAIALSALLIKNTNQKNQILQFESDLNNSRKILTLSGFQINQIYDTAKRLQKQNLQQCEQPIESISDKLSSYFEIKLNCTVLSIIEYGVYILSQLFILYFSYVKQQIPNAKITHYEQIVEYDIANGKIFKQTIIDLNNQFKNVLSIIHKDKSAIRLVLQRIDKAVRDGSFKRN